MFIIIKDTIINTDSVNAISVSSVGYNSTDADKRRLYKYGIEVRYNYKTDIMYSKDRFFYDSENERDKAFTKLIKDLEIRG